MIRDKQCRSVVKVMNYGSLIRKARKFRKWTLQDLAGELADQGIEIDTGNLSRIETGKQGISSHVLDGILCSFGISIEALLLKISEPLECSDTKTTLEKTALCPVISWNQAANWQNIQVRDKSTMADEWLICPMPHELDTYALRLSGESMQDPYGDIHFDDGDIVFFDPAEIAGNNSFIAVKESDEADVTFKQLIIEGRTKYLKALNPDWPDRITPVKNSAVICGVAICKYRSCVEKPMER